MISFELWITGVFWGVFLLLFLLLLCVFVCFVFWFVLFLYKKSPSLMSLIHFWILCVSELLVIFCMFSATSSKYRWIKIEIERKKWIKDIQKKSALSSLESFHLQGIVYSGTILRFKPECKQSTNIIISHNPCHFLNFLLTMKLTDLCNSSWWYLN